MSKIDFLDRFFDLYLNSDNITGLMLVDTIAFYTHNKTCLRLIVSQEEYLKIAEMSEQFGYCVFSQSVNFELEGNTWYSLSKNTELIFDEKYLLIISLDEYKAESCLEAEMNGEFKSAGKYFDYPLCCIEFYDKVLQSDPQLWALKLHSYSGNGPFPYHANRLATGWGGIAFTAELFPCSLNCKHAIQIGKQNEQAIRRLGLSKLADEVKEHALKPCILHPNGNVKKNEDRKPCRGDEISVEFID